MYFDVIAEVSFQCCHAYGTRNNFKLSGVSNYFYNAVYMKIRTRFGYFSVSIIELLFPRV